MDNEIEILKKSQTKMKTSTKAQLVKDQTQRQASAPEGHVEKTLLGLRSGELIIQSKEMVPVKNKYTMGIREIFSTMRSPNWCVIIIEEEEKFPVMAQKKFCNIRDGNLPNREKERPREGHQVHMLQIAVEKAELLNTGAFSLTEETNTHSPRRLEWILFNNLVIFCSSVEPALIRIPQNPKHCFPVNRTHSYEKGTMYFAKSLLFYLLQIPPPQTLIPTIVPQSKEPILVEELMHALQKTMYFAREF